jgi:hypothetical protein
MFSAFYPVEIQEWVPKFFSEIVEVNLEVYSGLKDHYHLASIVFPSGYPISECSYTPWGRRSELSTAKSVSFHGFYFLKNVRESWVYECVIDDSPVFMLPNTSADNLAYKIGIRVLACRFLVIVDLI